MIGYLNMSDMDVLHNFVLSLSPVFAAIKEDHQILKQLSHTLQHVLG